METDKPLDPEIKQLLEETKALVKDNHRMLRAIRREAWLGIIAKVIFWVVVIILPLYFLYPYLSTLPSAGEIQKALQVYQTGSL